MEDKIECRNCLGTGLIGNSEIPWVHVGPLSTCQICIGTGKVLANPLQNGPVETVEPSTATPTETEPDSENENVL